MEIPPQPDESTAAPDLPEPVSPPASPEGVGLPEIPEVVEPESELPPHASNVLYAGPMIAGGVATVLNIITLADKDGAAAEGFATLAETMTVSAAALGVATYILKGLFDRHQDR